MKIIKLKFFILVFIFCGSLSCNSNHNKFNMIQSSGLDADNLGLKTILFLNKDTGFIAGSSDEVTQNPIENSDTFAFVNRVALLYKTKDGGKTWINKNFGEGSFQNILYTNGSIYALKVSEKTFETEIYYSKDFGENWKLKASFPNVVSDLFSIDNLIVIIAKDEKNIFQFYISDDEGQHWIKKNTPYTPVYDVAVVNKNFLYLSSDIQENFRKNLLVFYNFRDNINEVVKLPKKFDCYFLTNIGNKIILCGKQDNRIAVYNLENDKLQYQYSTIGIDSLNFPVGFYDIKNENYIIVAHRKSDDISYRILKTVNNGKNWETIIFEKNKQIKPFCFINVNGKVKAWFFAGYGEFQILK